MEPSNSEKRVLLIGAGLTGICVLRRLSENKDFKLTCFERNYDIGGQWLYTDQTVEDNFGRPIQTAMYKNVRTNLPKQLIEIDGFPMNQYPAFPDKQQMIQYLNRIVDTCDIRKYIKFNTEVTDVKALNVDEPDTKWMVTYGDNRKKNENQEKCFDDVVICSGSCWTCNYPDVHNEKDFKGLIMHSLRYRQPEMYAGQNVAILGANFSGIDISFELAKYTQKVYLCHKESPLETRLPENVVEKTSGFKKFTTTSVVLDNGEELPVDTVIYCTGFLYKYPFLQDGIIKINANNRITNLFMNIIQPEYSTLFFIGIKKPVAFFPLSDHQASFVLSVLDGTAKLPTRDEMLAIVNTDSENEVILSQWEFDKEISKIAGNFEPLPPVLQKIWDYHFTIWRTEFAKSRTLSYKVIDHNSFVILNNAKEEYEA